ncbi:hypothetical protein F4677DRAFT_161398 [Hypoxylon crocopeplum]|nr:hypothetical protein F4677DRAFT_161398 [Hypoxylon crocopeplum]
MLIQYDNHSTTMDSTTIQRKVNLDSSFPLRPLAPHSSQLNISRPATIISCQRAYFANASPFILEPPCSPLSSRSGSSFSQGSSADGWEIIPTELSPPQTPKSKHEFDDLPRLDLIPPRDNFLKRSCDSPERYPKKVKPLEGKLSGLNWLLQPPNHEDRRAITPPKTRGSLHSPSPSPELRNEYIFSSKHASPPLKDPIVQWLNHRRKETDPTKGLLAQPQELGKVSFNIDLDFHSTPVFFREKQQHKPQFPEYCQRLRQELLPPRQLPKKGGCRSKKVHNNKKYLPEETDYIRFNKYEMKLSWEENKCLFGKKFPQANAELVREKQGIQGVHYRDNLHVPHLVDRGRRLVFLPNGHVEGIEAKVRAQGENKPYFSLTYLYPERALLYDWVPNKVKQVAAELVKERMAQRAQKRSEAIRQNTWVENLENGECACCYKLERERDCSKSSTLEHRQDTANFALPIKRETAVPRPLNMPSVSETKSTIQMRKSSLHHVLYADDSKAL